MIKEDIIVIYHGYCPDGFGGAYAAWKKFGDSAFYHPAQDRTQPEINIQNKEVYIIDFSYPKEVLKKIEQEAKRLVILDHHISVKAAVMSVREHVFDNDHSGVGIAWKYFHPENPMPKLLAYVEDDDLWKHSLPHWAEIGAFLSTIEFNFKIWEKFIMEFENKDLFEHYIEKGHAYAEYASHICNQLVKQAELVQFEGYEVLAINSNGILRSQLGNLLVKKHPPFSIIWSLRSTYWHFSLRSEKAVDVSEIAKKYGGGGHHSAAGFNLPLNAPLPFKIISQE